jgi:putative transposase
VTLPARSPNLNAFAERWVRAVKAEVLSRLILFGEALLWHVLKEYETHYHTERNPQGKGNVLLFPLPSHGNKGKDSIQCRERLGGLLKYYDREAA